MFYPYNRYYYYPYYRKNNYIKKMMIYQKTLKTLTIKYILKLKPMNKI